MRSGGEWGRRWVGHEIHHREDVQRVRSMKETRMHMYIPKLILQRLQMIKPGCLRHGTEKVAASSHKKYKWREKIYSQR